MNNKPLAKTQISIFTALALLFITLKLVGVISWSWWWVLSPLWLPYAAGILLLFIVFVVAFFFFRK